jgi:hypothetical protein
LAGNVSTNTSTQSTKERKKKFDILCVNWKGATLLSDSEIAQKSRDSLLLWSGARPTKLRGRRFSQIYSAVLHTNTRENNGNDGVPRPASFIWTAAIQSGRRGARRYQSHQWTQWNVLWWRGGRGLLRGWVAAALLSPPQQITLYLGRIWKYPINQLEECFGGSIVLHMHRI